MNPHGRKPFRSTAGYGCKLAAFVFSVLIALQQKGFADGQAPNPAEQYAIETWMTEDGMPQNIVTTLLQTDSGYIWAGTYNGIAQFDGVRFRVFTPASTPGLPNGRVTSLFKDRHGDIWIGHDTSDVTRFSGGKFEVVPLLTAWNGGSICGIQADAAGDVWALNVRGEAMRMRDGLLINPPADMAENPTLIPQMVLDGQHRLLMTRNGSVAEITPTGCHKLVFPSAETRPSYSRVAPGRKGGLWVVGEGHVRRWDGTGWQEDLGTFPWEDAYVMTMMETAGGQLLVGTLERGLFIYDRGLGWMNLNRSNGLPQDRIRCLAEDREHNIWVGTSGGLVLLRPRKVVMYDPPDGWQGCPVLAITLAHDGAVWAATEGAGLYHLQSNSWEHYGASNGLSNPFVWSVMEDSRRQIWAGTWGGGLFRLEGTNFVRKFDLAERGEPVTALAEFPPGTIWIGTTAGLIRCVDDQLERFASLGGAAAGDVRAIERGSSGEVWFGTQGQGLGRLKDGQLLTVHRAEGLPSNFILSLHQQSDGSLWIGTLDQGISVYEHGQFHTVSTDQGLPNGVIGHIEDDGLGNLWFSSQQGLFRADRGDLLDCAEGRRVMTPVLGFGKAEGMTTLAGSSGFTPSGFGAPDGRLWFPTARGIAVVSPKAVRRNQVPPSVWIEEILVDGQNTEINPVTDDRASNLVEPKRIVELKPGRRQLDIQFTGLSFTSPQRVLFKYRLEGLDADWTDGGTRRRVTYSFLPPGNYTFRVIACNSDGLWNETGDALGIVVVPHPWQRWWFKVALGFTGAALVGGGVYLESRRRNRRRLELMAHERELERERSRIARDIHDDLGASLTRISMLSESATEDLDDPARAAVSLDQIYSTARDLTRAMDEIVWAVDPHHDTLESLTNYVVRYAHDFLSAAGIRCRLDPPTAVPELNVRSEIRHNLFLAFKETLNNAVKHSGASEVHVTFEFVQNGFILMVADNGTGFDPEKRAVAPSGNRLVTGYGIANMRNRLGQISGRVEIQSQPGDGTQVALFVSLPDVAGKSGHS